MKKNLQGFIVLIIMLLTTSGTFAQWKIDEGFEGGVIPADWTTHDENNDGFEWMAYEDAAKAHSGTWIAVVNVNYPYGHDWLITPQVSIETGDAFIFFARAWNGTENMKVRLSTGGNAIGDFTIILDDVTGIGEDYTEYSYDLSAYDGQNVYLAIEWTFNDYTLIVDDVKLGQALPGDAGMVSIEAPLNYQLVDSSSYPSGTIQNYGSSDISNFDIICKIYDASETEVYSATETHSGTLSPDETAAVTFATSWTPTELGFYNIVMYTDLIDDPYNNNDTLTSETEVVEHFGTGGPDGMGYCWIDSHETGGPVYNWTEISGTGASAVMHGVPTFAGDDNFSEPIDFGFDFPFYGIDRTFFHVDINGEILLTSDHFFYTPYPDDGWDTDGNFFNYSFPIPGNSYFPTLVAVFWDNLFAEEGTGDVYYQTFGSEPNRYCVVQWNNLRFDAGDPGTNTICFQVIFYETTGEIIMQYKNVANGQSGSVCPHDYGQSTTVGLQADNTDIGICYLRELVDGGQYIGMDPPGNMLSNELAIRFYPGEDTHAPDIVYEDELWNTFNNTPELSVTITDMHDIVNDTLYYNIGSGWVGITHSSFEEPNIYHYQFPEITNSTTVNYYFAATDNSANQNRGTLPADAPGEYYTFKILPTDDVEVLFATPGNKIGYNDYQNIEYPKYTAALDAAGVTYDIYNWAEYEEYDIPETYKIIFIYSNSATHDEKHDTLSLALIEFLEKGTNENPKNIFTASDNLANSTHALGYLVPLKKFFNAYIRGGFLVPETPPTCGGGNGIGGPDIWEYSNGSIIGLAESPIGTEDLEIPVYSDSPDNVFNKDCPDSYTDVTNPEIYSSYSFLFEDGPFSGNAYSKENPCALWLDNLIYKSFFISFDISQFTSDTDINNMITEALEWFGYETDIEENPISENEFVTVYPNPSNGVFNVQMLNNKSAYLSMQIFNIQGQIIWQKELSNSINYTENINISNFTKGIYFIKINTGKKIVTKKIIIQ
ncbi:MAG: choice-of-anchor J domain-containing protein [Bacteroidales bacterium]|nr:choice-of-anchor J domain-containing protein [Bacteroidales bacterium]